MSRSGSRSVGRWTDVRAHPAIAEGLGDQVLVGEGDHRDPDAGHPPQLGGEHAARVDDHLGLDVAPLRPHAGDPAVADDDLVDPRVGEDLVAAVASALDQGIGELRRIEVAVGRAGMRRSARRR